MDVQFIDSCNLLAGLYSIIKPFPLTEESVLNFRNSWLFVETRLVGIEFPQYSPRLGD